MSTLRQVVRKLAPMQLRLAVAVARRTAADLVSRTSFADTRTDPTNLAEVVAVAQPIRHTAHFEGKLHNLTLAAHTLNGLEIPPCATVSFWRVIGRPTEAHGFRTGRAIINDRLSADIGGGLCQVASLLYELGLRTGMRIVERHPHSRDLYTEDTRFTPLGLDAAIVWGFKDVRWTNAHKCNVALHFHVEGETLHGSLHTAAPIPTCDLSIASHDEGSRRHVEVARTQGPTRAVVSRETYVIDPG
ncbi:MAG: VanW family protein [Alphaproteobacteria bacterium]|nr:VanW family protein [Alphaproteobacteria bacterium]